MTAQTALLPAASGPWAAIWKPVSRLGKGATGLVVRIALAFIIIAVGGVIAPLLAAELSSVGVDPVVLSAMVAKPFARIE